MGGAGAGPGFKVVFQVGERKGDLKGSVQTQLTAPRDEETDEDACEELCDGLDGHAKLLADGILNIRRIRRESRGHTNVVRVEPRDVLSQHGTKVLGLDLGLLGEPRAGESRT